MKLELANQEFLKEIEVRKYTPKTIRSYRNNLSLFLRYCEDNGVQDTEDVGLFFNLVLDLKGETYMFYLLRILLGVFLLYAVYSCIFKGDDSMTSVGIGLLCLSCFIFTQKLLRFHEIGWNGGYAHGIL